MAKATQSAKRHRQSIKRKIRNYAYRSSLRTCLRQAKVAIDSDSEDKEKVVSNACRELDRMVTKGIVQKNTAARKKSRLMQAMRRKSGTTAPIVQEQIEPVETGEQVNPTSGE